MSEVTSKATTIPATTTVTPSETLRHLSNPHSVQITTIRLNGDNFLRWSQSVRMYIRGQGKIGYITGDKKAPAVNDPLHAVWDAENSMVMTWLVNSMEEDISTNYMCYPTAKELWDNVSQMYSDLGNQSQVFELTLKLGEIRQGEDSVTKYFNSLKRLWQDLDLFSTYEWKSVDDCNHHKKTMEDDRIYKFLAGLNIEFDEVRGRIIGRPPLPSIGEVFAEVRREESRRSVMLGKKSIGESIETSALFTDATSKAANYQRRSDDKPRVWCDFCNKPRHTRETCWKIHGKPANWKNSKPGEKNRGLPMANEANSGSFNKEQLDQLLKLIKSNFSSGIPSVSLAQTGSNPKALSCLNSSPWIIDSGASDHMSSCSHLFNTYSPCSGSEKIRIADGSFSPIVGKGHIKLTEKINLNSVLHVPKLACNLLSDQNSGMMIGRARMIEGLYYLDEIPASTKKAQGETSERKDNFWEISIPLPNISFPENSHLPLVPSIGDSRSGGEILHTDHRDLSSELQVYTRKRFHLRDKDSNVNPAQHQSENPSSGTEIPGNSIPNPTSISPIVSDSSPTISDLDVPIAIRKGARNCTNHPIANYLSYQRLSKNHKAFISRISHLFVPRNIQEALDDPSWKLAVMEEMNALRRSGTWEIVDLPKGKKPVGCKWVFTIKCKADGSIERYKARLVAKGFTQTYGIDYQETFAPVAKINSIRILLSLAVNSDWPLHQLDVRNAFLNGDLEEEVFMSLPPGFEKGLDSKKVCKLNKALYGLKQSPRAWFERFGKTVISYGFLQSQADHTIFYKHSEKGKVAILIVYVDDIILTGDDETELAVLKKNLAKEFQIKDLGVLKYFLGMEFARSKEGIFVNQRKYILDLLGETGLLGCKMVETPIEANLKLQAAKAEEVKDRELYQRLVGKLIYLSHTRPDIAFAVSMVSQFMHSPGEKHFEAVYRILRYLKGTPGRGLLFKKHGHLQIEVYTDADWAGSVTDRRSTSGYCSFVGGNLVTWRSKKQNVVARSSAEAEFRAVAHGICEVMWIKRILEELKLSYLTPMKVYCDNKAAISIAHNPVLHDRTKHIEVDKHFIKEKINTGIICMTYLPTDEQLADVLTKGLHKKQFDKLTSKLAMEDIYKPA
ncbi:uncharacterized protein LOC141812295 [Curcuma longa]|uniref:uncharacterized protein LOC141812295 n=1 Tax=Curcuma longa TaxID=136217 RepID=UPI003D9F0FA3